MSGTDIILSAQDVHTVTRWQNFQTRPKPVRGCEMVYILRRIMSACGYLTTYNLTTACHIILHFNVIFIILQEFFPMGWNTCASPHLPAGARMADASQNQRARQRARAVSARKKHAATKTACTGAKKSMATNRLNDDAACGKINTNANDTGVFRGEDDG